jgi:ADP-ribose pyrophosphatase YjhB (NUDIX family)
MDERTPVVKAMALISRPRDGALLVAEYSGPDADPFHRLLGGHVEFGEYAADAVRRELMEEIAQPLRDLELLGVVENMFKWLGRGGHEVVFVFRAALEDPSAYEIAEQYIQDEREGPARVLWRSRAAVTPPLYPDGVADMAPIAPELG